MAYTQTLVATIALLVCLLLTLGLNEGVYSNTDLTVRLDVNTYANVSKAPVDCRFTRATGPVPTTFGVDKFSVQDDIAREFLYGGFSARGAVISGIILCIGAFVIAIVVKDLDMEMEAAEYKKGSWLHEGDTKAFVSGILFRLLLTGTALSMVIASGCSLSALVLQGYVPSVGIGVENVRLVPDGCDDDNVVHRSDSLKASFFFSALSVFVVGCMAYAVRYDIKASIVVP